jgi:hypothetical protein
VIIQKCMYSEMIVKKLCENMDLLVIFHKNTKNGLHFE